jgi:hypothetical protein
MNKHMYNVISFKKTKNRRQAIIKKFSLKKNKYSFKILDGA